MSSGFHLCTWVIDSSSRGSYTHRFQLLLQVCPLNAGFLVRWSGSHGSRTVVGTSKLPTQAQPALCAFCCPPVALWTLLCVRFFPHIRPQHLLLDSLHSTTPATESGHTLGTALLTLGFILSSHVAAASDEGFPLLISLHLSPHQHPGVLGMPASTWHATVEEQYGRRATILFVGCTVWLSEWEQCDASLRAVPLFYHLAPKWHAVFSLLGKCHLKNTQ